MNYRKVSCSECAGSGSKVKPWVVTLMKIAPRFGRRLTLFDFAWLDCSKCAGSGLMDEFDPNPEAKPGAPAPWLSDPQFRMARPWGFEETTQEEKKEENPF